MKMRALLLAVLLCSSSASIGQIDTVLASITYSDGKTVSQLILNKRLNHKKLIAVYGTKKRKLSLRQVDQFSINDSVYVVCKPPGSYWLTPPLSYKRVDSGAIELLEYRDNYFVRLGGFNYVEYVRKKPSRTLDEYVSDFKTLEKGDVPTDSVPEFVAAYNNWKNSSNTLSQMEQRINEYKILTIRLSILLLPSIGYEVGFTNSLTFNNSFGVAGYGFSNVGWFMNFGSNAQLRWYYNLNKRKEEKLNTACRSSNYIALGPALGLDLEGNIYRYLFVDFGKQEQIQYSFSDLSLGLGYDPFTGLIAFRYIGLLGFGF